MSILRSGRRPDGRTQVARLRARRFLAAPLGAALLALGVAGNIPLVQAPTAVAYDELSGGAAGLAATRAALGLPLPGAPANGETEREGVDHIFVVAEANRSYSQIIGDTAHAPYINQLAQWNGLAADYHAVSSAGLPNYLALTGGSSHGISSDCAPSPTCSVTANRGVATNIGDRLEASGRSWRAYMEAMPAACTMTDSGQYAVRHNPFVYYTDISGDPARCSSSVVPYSALSTDLAAAVTTPNLVWITPSLANDMQGGSVSQGDTWLKNNLSAIFTSPAWRTQNSILVLTWDQGAGDSHVATLVVDPGTRQGYRSHTAYDHYSVLRMVEATMGLQPLASGDAVATPMSTEFFQKGAAVLAASAATEPAACPIQDDPSGVTVYGTPHDSVPHTVAGTVSGSPTFMSDMDWHTDMTPTTDYTGGNPSVSPNLLGTFGAPLVLEMVPPNSIRSGDGWDGSPYHSITASNPAQGQLIITRGLWVQDPHGNSWNEIHPMLGWCAWDGAHWSATYTDVSQTPASWTANQTKTYNVTLFNEGDYTWPMGTTTPVRLHVHFKNGTTSVTDQAFTLPKDMLGAHAATFSIGLTAPGSGGSYTVEYQMVKEGGGGFNFTQVADVANVTVAATTGSIGGTVTDSVSHAAIAGAAITCSCGGSATTAANGTYTIAAVTAGTYSVTATASGHVTQTAPSVAVTSGNTTTQDFALVPAPPGSIAGAVRDATSAHNPIAGATVTCTCGPSTTTDGNGAYSLASVPTGSQSVTAAAGGFSPQTIAVTVNSGATTTQNFTLTVAPGSITGTITDASTHAAITGASVSDGIDAAALTNSSGVYTITPVAPGSYTVTASAAGYVSQSVSSVVVNAGQQTGNVNMALAVAPGSISGAVTDNSTHAAIVGATIACSCGNTSSGSGGAYSYPSLAPGTYTLTVSAPNYTSQNALVTVHAGAATTQNFAMLPAPGSITGTVTAAGGGAIAGASVSDGVDPAVTTNGSGVYTIPSVAPGSYTVTASATGYASAGTAATVAAGQQTGNVNLTLSPFVGPQLVQSAGAVAKSVAFPAPTTAGDLLVLTAGVHTGVSQPISAVGDGKNTWTKVGAFNTSGQWSDGEMWYAANAQPVTSISVTTRATPVALQVMEFSGAATTNPLDTSTGASASSTAPNSGAITPGSSNVLLVGFIAGHNNAQAMTLTGAGYTALTQQTGGTTTGASVITGFKALGSPSAQSFTGSFGSAMYWAAGIAAFKSGAPPGPGSISGTITDASTHTPISGAAVSCSCGNLTTGTNGVYTYSSLQPGTYSLTASATGYTSQTALVTVHSGQQSTQDFALLVPPGSITGTVTDASSTQPINGATVSDGVHPAVTTNSSGVYSITNVAPATYTVSASAPGHTMQSTSVTVTSGSQSTQNFALAAPPPGSITGTVTATGGAAISGASVSDGIDPAVTTNGSGIYTISNVAPGSYTVTASATGYTTQSASAVSVSSGAATTQNFTLPVAPGAISGTVIATGGGPIPGASVSDGVDPAVTTGTNGVYTIPNVAPGGYTVTASAAGYASGQASATVSAGQTTQNVNFSLAATAPPPGPKFVQSSTAISTTVSFTVPTTAGDLLVLSAGLYTGLSQQIKSVSDGKNTWTKAGAFATSGHNSDGELWYAANAQPVSSITVTTGASSVVLEAMEFSGVVAVNPLDVSAGVSNNTNAPSSGAATPTGSRDLVVGFIAGHTNAQAITVTSPGYTTLAQQTTGGSVASLISGYQVLNAASAQSFSGSVASSMWWAAGVFCFRSA